MKFLDILRIQTLISFLSAYKLRLFLRPSIILFLLLCLFFSLFYIAVFSHRKIYFPTASSVVIKSAFEAVRLQLPDQELRILHEALGTVARIERELN